MGGKAFSKITCARLDNKLMHDFTIALEERFTQHGATVCNFFPKESHGDIDIVLAITKSELIAELQKPLIVDNEEFRVTDTLSQFTKDENNPYRGLFIVALSNGVINVEVDFVIVNNPFYIDALLLTLCLQSQLDLLKDMFKGSPFVMSSTGIAERVRTVFNNEVFKIHISDNVNDTLQLLGLSERKLYFTSEEELKEWMLTSPFNKKNPLVFDDKRTIVLKEYIAFREKLREIRAKWRKVKVELLREECKHLPKEEQDEFLKVKLEEWRNEKNITPLDNTKEFFL